MARQETDYLIVGAGAVGLAFADTLLDHSDARIMIVDRHGKPGGHWNDAYSFVALHQPSAYYGVASMQLGSGQRDSFGPNKGLFELASGHEVSGYFDRVMHQRLLPSGRVTYIPMADVDLEGRRYVSLLSGEATELTVRRKIVDATYYATSVPSTHTPKFRIAEGSKVVPPNALPDLWRHGIAPPPQIVILGAGKTAMDVGVWLLRSGFDANRIAWVVPRDSWLLNRQTTQPSMEFFSEVFGGQLAQMRALGESRTADEVFTRLEADGVMLRIDRTVTPSMFHFATISTGEVDLLRQISRVIRHGRVRAVEPDALVFDDQRVAVPVGTLFVDCTASAVERRPLRPVFAPDRITLQMVRVPQPAFSAALCAFLEATVDDDDAKNRLARPVPLPDRLDEYPMAMLVNMMNQQAWGKDKALRAWIRDCRLDGFGKIVAAIDPADTAKVELLQRIGAAAMSAAANIPKLAAVPR